MSDLTRIADLLFPDLKHDPEYYENFYPQRNLGNKAVVTRFAPSPTGDIHMGNLFACTIEERIAHQSGGVFFLRIEDTDKKREIKDGVMKIVRAISKFDVNFDEGPIADNGSDVGSYGPYRQSLRKDIYQTYAKKLFLEGHVYPCFCTEEELKITRTKQKESKIDTGYYGEWAVCRNLTLNEIENNLKKGMTFTIRLRSEGNANNKIVLEDVIRGRIELPENTHDIPILKTDGIPPYHFAHAIDDHLMRVTHVLRGDEWLSSVPVHYELFNILGFKKPVYGHLSPLMKMDGDSKRKLSKRKDPEALLDYYHKQGYDIRAVMEYLMTILNSNYEDWRRQNKEKPYTEFPVSISKMGHSGILFDLAKLNDISRETISTMSTEEVYEKILKWAHKYDTHFASVLLDDPLYAKSILSIDRGGPKPRKDIAKWGEVRSYMSYFYDGLYNFGPENVELKPENISDADAKAILNDYREIYSAEDDNEQWFAQIRKLTEKFGYAPDMKAYRESPETYKGNVGDVSTLIRIAVTGRKNTPDLCKIMKLLGKDRVLARIEKFESFLKMQ